MAPPAEKVVSDLGKRLGQTPPNKDSLLKLLRQAAGALSELKQSSSLQPALEPLSVSLVWNSLLQHKDKDVRLLVAVCLTEIIRVLAPNPPYSDEILKGVFKLLVSIFADLADTASAYFSRRVKILETVAALKCCVLMLDIGCEDLVLEMFNVFFSVIREDHQQSLINSMLSIMTQILDEKVSQPLLDVILRNLLKEEKGVPPTSFKLAVSIIHNCTEKLEPFIRGFLTSSILDRDTVGSELKEYYHELIFEIFQCAPQMLLAVMPNLIQELLTDQVDVRIKAVRLLGKLFSLSGCHVAHEYRQLFVEFLKRFSDKSVEVRASAVECAKACFMANPSGTEAIEVRTALEGRLLDFDDKVRVQAVNVICDLAKSNPRFISPDLVLLVAERLRDKKVSVRKFAMQKLLELYRAYCTMCSKGVLTLTDHFEQIPCRILTLCFDKDCIEFRPQNMELVLAEDLFPASIAVEDRIKHWLYFFPLFKLHHIKALHSVLSQKRRLQTEMQMYLAFRKNEKENLSNEVQNRILASFTKMSASFIDPSKAEASFRKLHQMKDKSIFNALLQLLDQETTVATGQTIRDTYLRRIGEKHPHYEFLRILSMKCSYGIISREHVHCILLELLSEENARNSDLETAGINLLLTIVNMFPSLLRGSEELLLRCFSLESNQLNENLLQVVAKAGGHVSIKLSDIYSSLERACLEGTRRQSKYAVSAMAALTDASDQLAFSHLYEKLVDSLQDGQNIPTVLQSLGSIAQYSIQTYESREDEIRQFITEKLFQTPIEQPSHRQTDIGDVSGCSPSCRLQIYGLKTLMKSYLPHQATHVRNQIMGLLNVLLKFLPEGNISEDIISSESDKSCIRLAAAKAVLQLARRWDLHISPQIFRLTMLKARDPSSDVKRSFLNKIYKLLKARVIPNRFACAFAIAGSDYLRDVRESSLKYLTEFIEEYGKEARIHQTCAVQDSKGETMMNYPEYVVVFLIHFLAHDLGFPPLNCLDGDAYARFCSPLVVMLRALMNPAIVDSNKSDLDDTVSYILSVFRAIRKATDAVDAHITPKLHLLADIGVLITKVLSDNLKSFSHTPRMVFLPSSFYKVSFGTRSEEESLHFSTDCSFGRNFIEKILHKFESDITQSTGPHTKHGRKLQDDSAHFAAVKHGTSNLGIHKQTDPWMYTTKEEREKSDDLEKQPRVITRQLLSAGSKNQPVLLYTSSSSVELPLEGYDHSHEAPKSTRPASIKDHLSSCGSVVSKPSFSCSQVSNKNTEFVICSSSEKYDRESLNSISAESDDPSKCSSKTNQKVLGDNINVLVGDRIKLWFPVDKCFHCGTVSEFDSINGTHKITYDNGEVERLCLANERWEVISKGSVPKEVPSKVHLKDICLVEHVDTYGVDTAQQQMASSEKQKGNHEKSSVVACKRKGAPKPSVSANTNKSASKVITENTHVIVRRTRRRKV